MGGFHSGDEMFIDLEKPTNLLHNRGHTLGRCGSIPESENYFKLKLN